MDTDLSLAPMTPKAAAKLLRAAPATSMVGTHVSVRVTDAAAMVVMLERLPKRITLRQFAKRAGVRVIVCGPGWEGGRYGFTTEDNPQCATCGFSSHAAAYRGWLAETFGAKAAEAFAALLSDGHE